MTGTGLVIDGVRVPVEGVEVINYLDDPTLAIAPGDGCARPTRWIRQVIAHTTKGDWPQTVKPGVGPSRRGELVAGFWRGDPEHSAAHLVAGGDHGVCIADLLKCEAYHATVSNPWSVGIEFYQEAGGVLYEGTIRTGVKMIRAVCLAFGIQYQIQRGPYSGHPLGLLEVDGGPSVVGIFGHRDNTERRGRGDPGDYIVEAIIADGAEALDFASGEHVVAWKDRQAWLQRRGHKVAIDGVPGPATVAALVEEGFPGGVWAFGSKA